MHRPYSHVVKWSRTLHIYVTMYAFILMLFFAFTGFFLNHEEWFTRGEAAPLEKTGTIPGVMLVAPDKLAIVELLRSQYGANGAVTTFDVDADQMHIELAGPGRGTTAEIDRVSGALRVSIEARGWVVRMDDLHRGKNSGRAWSWIIDISAISLFLGSLTGILMWVGLPRRRKLGLVALGVSVAMCLGLYWLFVP